MNECVEIFLLTFGTNADALMLQEGPKLIAIDVVTWDDPVFVEEDGRIITQYLGMYLAEIQVFIGGVEGEGVE